MVCYALPDEARVHMGENAAAAIHEEDIAAAAELKVVKHGGDAFFVDPGNGESFAV
ncbi:hypothetical protein D3C81_2205290 [compost metagenome]